MRVGMQLAACASTAWNYVSPNNEWNDFLEGCLGLRRNSLRCLCPNIAKTAFIFGGAAMFLLLVPLAQRETINFDFAWRFAPATDPRYGP